MNSQFNIFTQEAIDSLTIENLFQSYGTCYWCIVDAKRSYAQHGADFFKEDITNNEEVLKALERIILYYAPATMSADSRMLEILRTIDDEFASKDAKEKIASMNDDV